MWVRVRSGSGVFGAAGASAFCSEGPEWRLTLVCLCFLQSHLALPALQDPFRPQQPATIKSVPGHLHFYQSLVLEPEPQDVVFTV